MVNYASSLTLVTISSVLTTDRWNEWSALNGMNHARCVKLTDLPLTAPIAADGWDVAAPPPVGLSAAVPHAGIPAARWEVALVATGWE
ncbi:uncharacterized protein A4U43_C07F27920 [Asparagus officinalis]|uniref:Uncharacterized protein n=1 Tax=Asparagus officinalis TaxID=4686 RepID=A0A5P1EIK2_ASPOF|nr:uncharacterized protein A4U43_C07F27920 [Asparagus officinalis]